MAPIQEFSNTAYVVLLSAVLCLVIKFVFLIVIINREQRVEENQPQQPAAAAEARNLTRNDDDVNQNHNIQRIRQIPREHDERQG